VTHWFALDDSRPLFAFAGIWRLWTGERKGETGEHQLFAFLKNLSFFSPVATIRIKSFSSGLCSVIAWRAIEPSIPFLGLRQKHRHCLRMYRPHNVIRCCGHHITPSGQITDDVLKDRQGLREPLLGRKLPPASQRRRGE
jgi:hypothetical protein